MNEILFLLNAENRYVVSKYLCLSLVELVFPYNSGISCSKISIVFPTIPENITMFTRLDCFYRILSLSFLPLPKIFKRILFSMGKFSLLETKISLTGHRPSINDRFELSSVHLTEIHRCKKLIQLVILVVVDRVSSWH